MATIGIVTCQILELEVAYIVSNDSQVSDIFVMDNEFSQDLISELKTHKKKPVHPLAVFKNIGEQPDMRHQVLIRVMEVGLHSDIQKLQRHVVSAVKEMAPHVDSVLLGYGLCGNALSNAQDLFAEVSVPVMLPMDGDHPVDDCVGLIIGGREKYYGQQCKCAGTMFINAGFSRHWQNFMEPSLPEKLLPKKDKILKRMMRDYQRSLLLPTKVLGETEMMANVEAFNAKFNLRTESTPGTLALIEKAWQETKNLAVETNL